MYRKSFKRPKVAGESRSFERKGRWAIPQDEGSARFLEAMILLSAVLLLAIAVGLTVGVPLALMFSDFCKSIQC